MVLVSSLAVMLLSPILGKMVTRALACRTRGADVVIGAIEIDEAIGIAGHRDADDFAEENAMSAHLLRLRDAAIEIDRGI